MKVFVNREAFQYVELQGEQGVTAQQLASKLGISKRSAATWLSKWAARGYLKHQRGAWRKPGIYYMDNTCKWWGDKVFDSEREVA